MKPRNEGKISILAKATIVTALLLVLLMASSLLMAQRFLIDHIYLGIDAGTATPHVIGLTNSGILSPESIAALKSCFTLIKGEL